MITVIAKRYGSKVQSVTPNFDARAMNEIGFRRDNEWSIDKDEFEESYQQLESHELTAAASASMTEGSWARPPRQPTRAQAVLERLARAQVRRQRQGDGQLCQASHLAPISHPLTLPDGRGRGTGSVPARAGRPDLAGFVHWTTRTAWCRAGEDDSRMRRQLT
jgi:hypothetical protein